jgi:hypothetical protein
MRTLQAAAAAAPLVVIADAAAVPSTDEWLWEIAGLKESYGDAVLIGGRIIDSMGVLVSPDPGRRADDPGYFGTALKQRTAGVVSLHLAGIDSRWLRSLEADPLDHATIDELGSALARIARSTDGRIVISPFIVAEPSVG